MAILLPCSKRARIILNCRRSPASFTDGIAYTFTNIGAFGVVALVGRKGEANILIDDYRGLAKANPMLALVMAIFLFSLAGIPPTAGFVGKFAIFGSADIEHDGTYG